MCIYIYYVYTYILMCNYENNVLILCSLLGLLSTLWFTDHISWAQVHKLPQHHCA